MQISQLKNKKILILGFGLEGVDTLNFLRRYFPVQKIGVADKNKLKDFPQKTQEIINKDKNLEVFLGKNYLKSLGNFEIVFKSPGISLFFKEIKTAEKKGIEISSQTKIFFDLFSGKTIGITGTKGKSTTTTLIYKILKQDKKQAYLLGNIGNPVLGFLQECIKNKNCKEKIAVYELSCHQLYNLEKSPNIAVFLNLFPEHLDYYPNLKEYYNSKLSIFLNQKKDDFLVFNADSKEIAKHLGKVKSQKFYFSLSGKKKKFEQGCYFKEDSIYFHKKGKDEKIISRNDILLKGKFNLQNAMAAILAAKIFGVSNADIKSVFRKFPGLEHRLEFVGERKGIKFYNDSLATLPEATIEAINSFEKVDTLILGGYDRGLVHKELAKRILRKKIKNLAFFPGSGQRIWQEIKKRAGKNAKFNTFFGSSMKEIVDFCYKKTGKNGICLLSCASPSFGLFKDYKDRGDQFKKWIKKLS
ncbi:MAG: UDP-N-acetylmuramoyl-L-alanine--D-glutamate ligase [bacterium]|nr:UDP-N-acetylmuramoyl-L-alanine--D-glutamate ligase [bacterium]